jgi:hypothetical protein
MREVDGWVYSSQAVGVRVLDGGEAISLDRLRRAVSPTGEVVASLSQVRLELLDPRELAFEARSVGLVPERPIRIPPDEDYVGSMVVVARKSE